MLFDLLDTREKKLRLAPVQAFEARPPEPQPRNKSRSAKACFVYRARLEVVVQDGRLGEVQVVHACRARQGAESTQEAGQR